MAKISTKPPSGMRDLLPAEVKKRRAVINTISTVYERHGFEPLETPSMERLEVLLGKYGEEGDRLVFKVLHRGRKLERALGRERVSPRDLSELGLRYDLTVPFARVYAAHREALGSIFKRYQIQPVWRADRPAKGRFREFYQCDVDIVGTPQLLAEIDLFMAITEIMGELGFGEFTLLLNHRGLLRGLLRALGAPMEQETGILVTLDKLDKIGPEGVRKALSEQGVSPSLLAGLDPLFQLVQAGAGAEKLKDFFRGLDLPPEGEVGLRELFTLLDWAGALGIGKRIRFNPLLARGLDYYTGAIYELRLEGEVQSLGGGGRYDGLIGSMAGDQVPAVGFSFGLERLLVLMEERGMFDTGTPAKRLLIAAVEEEAIPFALEVAQTLRHGGLVADLFPRRQAPGKVFRWAQRARIEWVVLAGGEELRSGLLTLKNMVTGEFKKIPKEDLPGFFQGI